MAKISARGCSEVARFRLGTGSLFLMRSDGVLLWKSSVEGDGWKVARRGHGATDGLAYLAKLRDRPDYVEVR